MCRHGFEAVVPCCFYTRFLPASYPLSSFHCLPPPASSSPLLPLLLPAQPYVESELFKSSTGWKEMPETINGRAAMLGEPAVEGFLVSRRRGQERLLL